MNEIRTMQNNATILIAAAFTMIGFALGRVTAPAHGHCPHAGGCSPGPAMHHMEWVGEAACGEDVQVIVKTLEAEGFEGDTVFSIPGGVVKMVRSGDDVEVEVEMEDAGEGKPGEEVIVTKRIMVVESDGDR